MNFELGRFLLKVLVTAIVISAVSEIGKRSSIVAAILASLPLTSILAMIWLYWDTADAQKVVNLSTGILWAVLPSLLFFILLPIFLKNGLRFGTAMLASCVCMFLGYTVYVYLLGRWGMRI